MNSHNFLRDRKSGLAALAVAILLGTGSLAAAGENKKPAAPAKPAPAARPAAPASKPAGGAAGAAHGATGATTTHGPSANGAGASHGPTANGTGGTHTTTTTGAHTTTTTAGTHTTTGGGTHPGGTTAGGASHSAIKTAAPRGSTEHLTRTGATVRTRPDGRPSDIHDAKRGMDIHHGLDGGRRVSVERHDGSRLVAERGRRGYVERGYSYHGHDFGRRAYYYHGREYNRYYRGYGYHGVYLNVYAPGYYYAPGFYGWAYNPWAAPINYGWGWGGSPWFGFYGGYFAPYPVYPSAAFWLTDYIISQDLQAAYAARQEAAVAAGEAIAAGGPPALTPEVKQEIADEVKAQLALENAEAQQAAAKQDADPGSSGIQRMMADGKPHVFVVGGGLDLTDASGQECAVSEGDALQMVSPPQGESTTANLVVLASKGGKECAKTTTVVVKLDDLQEMQNHMRETIDQGLQDLQAKQGKGGLPAAPPSAQAKPTEPEYAEIAPPPDPKDEQDIKAQTQEADASDKDASADTGGGSPIGGTVSAATGGTPTSTVALGQTTDQVTAALGQPTKKADLGTKVIYYYDGMKITFKGGKVSNVE